MSKIDETKLQMFVDNELSHDERIEVENFIKNNQEARSLVESYKKINHLISSTYNQIKSDDLPKRTLDLLMDEKPSFLKQLMNYEVKLIPALGSVAALAIVAVMSLNFFKIENQVNPSTLMSENNRHVVRLKSFEINEGDSVTFILDLISQKWKCQTHDDDGQINAEHTIRNVQISMNIKYKFALAIWSKGNCVTLTNFEIKYN